MSKNDLSRLEEIRCEMLDLAAEAKSIIRSTGRKTIFERAKATWLGSVLAGLGSEEYITKFNNTFVDTLSDLGYHEGDEENEEE